MFHDDLRENASHKSEEPKFLPIPYLSNTVKGIEKLISSLSRALGLYEVPAHILKAMSNDFGQP